MTRKHYIAVANAISCVKDQYTDHDDPEVDVDESNGAILDIAERLCHIFAQDNGNFDKTRFLAACGYEYDISPIGNAGRAE